MPSRSTLTLFVFWRPLEVGNGVGSADELYGDNGYDYYTNQGISQWLGLSLWESAVARRRRQQSEHSDSVKSVLLMNWQTAVSDGEQTTHLLPVHSVNSVCVWLGRHTVYHTGLQALFIDGSHSPNVWRPLSHLNVREAPHPHLPLPSPPPLLFKHKFPDSLFKANFPKQFLLFKHCKWYSSLSRRMPFLKNSKQGFLLGFIPAWDKTLICSCLLSALHCAVVHNSTNINIYI